MFPPRRFFNNLHKCGVDRTNIVSAAQSRLLLASFVGIWGALQKQPPCFLHISAIRGTGLEEATRTHGRYWAAGTWFVRCGVRSCRATIGLPTTAYHALGSFLLTAVCPT